MKDESWIENRIIELKNDKGFQRKPYMIGNKYTEESIAYYAHIKGQIKALKDVLRYVDRSKHPDFSICKLKTNPNPEICMSRYSLREGGLPRCTKLDGKFCIVSNPQ